MRQCHVVKVCGGVNYCGRDGHHTLLKVICNKMRPVNQQMVIVVSRAGSARFTTSIRPSLIPARAVWERQPWISTCPTHKACPLVDSLLFPKNSPFRSCHGLRVDLPKEKRAPLPKGPVCEHPLVSPSRSG